jgi:creatinine amidohydrolase
MVFFPLLAVDQLDCTNFVLDDAIRAIYPDGFSGWDVEHSGVLETSLMLEFHPHLVNMSKVPVGLDSLSIRAPQWALLMPDS